MEILSIIFLGIVILIGCSILGFIFKVLWFLIELLAEGFDGCLGCFGLIFVVVFIFLMLAALVS